jgi:hypothetical protein
MRDELSIRQIMDLDPCIFSREQKQALIEELYGKKDEWTWKRDLVDVSSAMKRWQDLLAIISTNKGKPYRVGYNSLVRRAEFSPPPTPGHTVAAFTDWIFRLYKPQREYEALMRGARFEREVALRRVKYPQHSGWKLIYDGMNGSNEAALPISQLTVNGSPIYGKPDLIFREKRTGRILITEIKVSECDVPTDGWPNLQAQLWAYSKLDELADASEILLAGEVWSYKFGVRRRATVRYDVGDHCFQLQNQQLFDIYSQNKVAAPVSRKTWEI